MPDASDSRWDSFTEDEIEMLWGALESAKVSFGLNRHELALLSEIGEVRMLRISAKETV